MSKSGSSYEKIDPIKEEIDFFIKENKKYSKAWCWDIYSKTKYGDKLFLNYTSKEKAINAAAFFGLNLIID